MEILYGIFAGYFAEAAAKQLCEKVRGFHPVPVSYTHLDNTKLKRVFGWRPRWDIGTAVEKTVEWAQVYRSGGDVRRVMESQIALYDVAWEKGAESRK